MNSDEIGSTVRKVLLMALSGLAAKYHVEGSTLSALVTDVVDLGVLAWGVYVHWNMRKVPEDSRVLPPLALKSA